MTISRVLISAATAAFVTAQMLGAAQAATYNLTLADTLYGPESGTGSFTVNGAIPSTGLDVITASSGGLTSLNFLIDGNNFTLANALPGASVTFRNGNLINLFYMADLNGIKLTLNTLGLGYVYGDLINLSHSSAGTISASATPLPPTWTMMLIGLAGFGLMLYRRKGRDAFIGAVPA